MFRLPDTKMLSSIRSRSVNKKPLIKLFLSPKTVLLSVFGLLALILLPFFYQESWLSPFSTLNVPNSLLHPHAFSEIGYIDSSDPSHPLFTSSRSAAQELLKDLSYAKPIPGSSEAVLDQAKVRQFILHRAPSRFHNAEDFPLQYYPDLQVVRFGGQEFQIDDSTLLLLNNLPEQMKSGWWKQ